MTIGDRDQVTMGIVCMLVGILLLSAMDATAKWMVAREISPVQIIALRSLIILPALLVGYWGNRQLHLLMPKRRYWQVARGLVGFWAPFCFFLGLRYLPLSDAVVVFFSSTFMTTMLSVLMLKEHVGWHRWTAIGIGYIGVVVAMAPQGGGLLIGYLLVLAASLAYAFLFVSGRFLSATETVPSLVFCFNLGAGCVAMLLLPFTWTGMHWEEVAALLLLAGLAVSGHFLLTLAFSRAPVSAVVPFEYSALLWAVCFDYIIWHQLPTLATWAGAALIIGSGLYVLYREQRHERQKSVAVSP